MTRLGIVALESSHVDQFCRILNRPDDERHLDGARIVAVCPQDNRPERVEELCTQFGIETVVESPGDMVPLVDAAMMLGRDGAQHCRQTLPFLTAGKPCFVDKPFAHSMEDATLMIETAREHSAPIMTSSALRFAVELEEAGDQLRAAGELWHCSLIGPGELFFYGIHLSDVLMRLMGPGAEAVADMREETMDLVSVSYGDGRSACLQVLRQKGVPFTGLLVGAEGTVELRISDPGYYRRQMQAFLQMVETGNEPVPEAEMLEAVQILVAADRSAKQGGRQVRLAEVYPWKRPF